VKRERPIRVLVVDDSPSNRRAITQILEGSPGIEVVDRAADGDEGLKKAEVLLPDVITLDLEMPRLDGYTFLRVLMARAPTPVIVLSSYAHPSDVFKALELGAFDFVAKPTRSDKDSLDAVRAQLVEKVRAAKEARRDQAPTPPPPRRAEKKGPDDVKVVLIGASTGGPPALQRLIEAISGAQTCLLVCQHMPARFTRAFAERLDHSGAFRVAEAEDGNPVEAGRVYIAPGGRHLELAEVNGRLVTQVPNARPSDKHAPSVDRLFASAAKVLGRRAFGLVLTGMGNDGEEGTKAIAAAGGEVWAEAESTAVVFGMPRAAIATGKVAQVMPLTDLGTALLARLKS
jgi:two-component system, chemotaxis family, protein-glutamate methylesterase/glutaminase